MGTVYSERFVKTVSSELSEKASGGAARKRRCKSDADAPALSVTGVWSTTWKERTDCMSIIYESMNVTFVVYFKSHFNKREMYIL